MKWPRRIVSIGGKIIGGLVIAQPAIAAWQGSGGDFEQFGKNVSYNYIGWDGTNLQTTQTAKGLGQVALGIILMKVFSYAARHF